MAEPIAAPTYEDQVTKTYKDGRLVETRTDRVRVSPEELARRNVRDHPLGKMTVAEAVAWVDSTATDMAKARTVLKALVTFCIYLRDNR